MPDSGLIISQVQDVTVVDFRHTPVVDAGTAQRIADDLYRLVDEERRTKLLLDFSAVRMLASQVLGALVALRKKADNIGGQVVLCGVAPNLFRIFQLTRLDAVLRFAPDVERGLLAFDQPGEAGGIPAPPRPEGGRWRRAVNRQVRIFFAGALILVPLAITAWVIWSVGAWLDNLGFEALGRLGADVPDNQEERTRGIGALILLGIIYLVGLLTHLWLFRGVFGLLERLVTHVPGVKTIYESVRDLMKLFGGESRRMGRVVQYNRPGSDMAFLGVLTNENPLGLPENDPNRKVSVYLPLSYMIGGPTLLVSPKHIVEVDLSVEQCMKLCATAQVGSKAIVPPRPDGGKALRGSRGPEDTKGTDA